MILQVTEIAKRFGTKQAVDGVSFAVERGESFGLLGPNGAGKSTTIAMISGLIPADRGEIHVGGVNILAKPGVARRAMGVVPQDIALYPTLSARENLNFWGAMYGLSGRDLATRVDEALEIVSLSDRQKDRIQTYSGGMKRRINIAASLLHQPALLIMDEPTVGIDPQSRNHILETIQRLNREKGMTVLYTSHYMEEVEYLCTRLAIIDHGKVIAQGNLDEVRQVAGSATTVRLRVSEPDEQLVAMIGSVPGVQQAKAEGDEILALVEDTAETLAPLVTAITSVNKRVVGIDVNEPNLESVFLHLTGRALRD